MGASIGIANGAVIKTTGDTAVRIASDAAVGIANKTSGAASSRAGDAYIGTIFIG